MLALALAWIVVIVAALVVYVAYERLGWQGVGLAALRTVALGTLVLLWVNPLRLGREPGGPATVLLDASLSMAAAGGRWPEALDSARARLHAGATVLRFGSAVASFDSFAPTDGLTRLGDALVVARSFGRPIVVMTDGELTEQMPFTDEQLRGVVAILFRRDTLPNVALLDVAVPDYVRRTDTLTVRVVIGAWGALPSVTAALVVREGGRVVVRIPVELPPPPAVAPRYLRLPAALLGRGERILRVSISTDGDREPGDNERLRLLTVTDDPAVVVIADPPDWEARFLVRTLAEVARTPTSGYARVAQGRWVDMHALRPVPEELVQRRAREAALVVVRGALPPWLGERARGSLWHWPQRETGATWLEGEWYVNAEGLVSPVAALVAGLRWDSLPPLTGLRVVEPPPEGWVGLSARRGRQGVARPVLLGYGEGVGRRVLVVGEGLWRWAMRGGAAGEAYRTLVASAVDWLLGAGGATTGGRELEVARVTPRGVPVRVAWRGERSPDSLRLRLERGDSVAERVLHFGPTGEAHLVLDTGVYRWSVAEPPRRGWLAVEPYSDEFHLNPVASLGSSGAAPGRLVERETRRWWIFWIVIAALVGEWAWRQRRGLP